MKARELIRTIEQAGWYLARVQGSHHVYKHRSKPGRLVIPIHAMNGDIPIGTLLSILKQAGLK